jgi:hypothetical protein
MKYITLMAVSFIMGSCNSNIKKNDDTTLKEWILKNQHQLMLSSDSIIQDYYNKNILDSGWISSSMVIRKYAPNIFGSLVKKARDTTECIVVELTFYKDTKQKRSILISAEDSTCLKKLSTIILETDSTENFIFGKNTQPIY